MSFENPRFLFLFALLVPVFFSMVRQYVKQQKVFPLFLQKFDGEKQMSVIRSLNIRYVVMSFFFMLFLILIIIAFAGPRWGLRLVPEYRRGLDVVLAMDVSRSMDVKDVNPSRLSRASRIAEALVRASPGIRFAVAVGKGSGILAVPLTDDPEAVLACLSGISSSVISSQGTNLENLILASLSGFQDSFPTRRRIILFSDGESHSGNLNQVYQKLNENDIGIVAVAMGTENGGPVPAVSGMLRNPDGSPVISFLHPEPLAHTAGRSGGIYIDGSKVDAFAQLNAYINSLASESNTAGYRQETRSRWHGFVIAAIICFALSALIESGWRWER